MIYDELAKRLKEGQWVDKEEMHMRSNALRAVIETCKSWGNQRVIPISYILDAIEKELSNG